MQVGLTIVQSYRGTTNLNLKSSLLIVFPFCASHLHSQLFSILVKSLCLQRNLLFKPTCNECFGGFASALLPDIVPGEPLCNSMSGRLGRVKRKIETKIEELHSETQEYPNEIIVMIARVLASPVKRLWIVSTCIHYFLMSFYLPGSFCLVLFFISIYSSWI